MLHGKKLFIILDLKSGYHQVLMDEESLELTTFITKFGTFQYVRMPFGLKNAPAYFTMMLEDILVGLVRVSCLIYIDDIIVFGETLPELIDNYVKVLGRLSKANMKVNVLKMQLVCEEVKYLGVMISGDGIAASEEKIEQLDKLHVITNKSELKSLLGLAAYLSPFIPCYAARTKCLSSLLKDKVPFEWGPEQQEAVEGIIDTLKKRTRLAQPDPSAEFHLYTDASCEIRKDRNGKPYQTDGHYQKPKPYYAGDKTGKDQQGRGKKVYSKATTVTKKSKSPEEYMAIVNTLDEEKNVLVLLDTGCSMSIANCERIPDSFILEKEIVDLFELELADGKIISCNKKWKIKLKAQGAFGKYLYFTEWVIPLKMGKDAAHDILICFETIIRLDLLGARFPIQSEILEEWEDEWRDLQGDINDLKCENKELGGLVNPLLKHYMLQIRWDEPSELPPMELEL
ncbi:hypothetical protein ADUPG1_000675, partial [Aduncisulcus paluster]